MQPFRVMKRNRVQEGTAVSVKQSALKTHGCWVNGASVDHRNSGYISKEILRGTSVPRVSEIKLAYRFIL